MCLESWCPCVLELLACVQSTTTSREKPRSDQENKELTNLALRGLQLLSAWTQQVMELVRM